MNPNDMQTFTGQNMQAVDPTRLALLAKKKELVEQIRVSQERISQIDKVLELFPHPYYNLQGISDQISAFAGLPESQQPRGGLI
jgi:hypothetical protein